MSKKVTFTQADEIFLAGEFRRLNDGEYKSTEDIRARFGIIFDKASAHILTEQDQAINRLVNSYWLILRYIHERGKSG